MWKTALLLLQLQLLVTANCPIFLTVTLEGQALSDACLEINWGPDCVEPPEWVGVFSEDPSVSSMKPLLRLDTVSQLAGKAATHIKLGKLQFPGGWQRPSDDHQTAIKYPRGKCLPFYVASYRGNELLTVNCLKIQPNWLAQLTDGDKLPLKRLFLPGTHASGAYITNYSQTKSLLVKEYLVAQHFDVWSQLVFGIRYLDLSVGYRNADSGKEADNFWVVNENMFINPLVEVLRDVRRFVRMSKEFLVLDFSSFPIGFYKHPEIYSSLYHLLRQELGEILYERNVSASEHCADRSFGEMQLTDRHVMLLFPTQELPYPENESVLLCTPWQRFSVSYMNISQTLDYMRLLFSRKPESPVQDDGWIFHGVQSMEQSLNTHKLQTTKRRAALINLKIDKWLNGPWGLNANVVAIDYFSNTNLVDVAIQANVHKAFMAAHENFISLEILNRR